MRRTLAPGLRVSRALRWTLRDSWDKRWWPQGVTTSADASDTEDIGGRRVLAAAWYAKDVAASARAAGSRSWTLRRRYRHVLLVVPSFGKDGTLRLDRLNVHAGGIVWCGPYLHIAATKKGLYTARVDDIMRVPDDSRDPDRNRIGFHDGKALDVRLSLRPPGPVRLPLGRGRRLRADPLLVPLAEPLGHAPGSWSRASTAAAAPPPGCSAYPLDPESMHLVPGEDGLARPVLLEQGGIGNMQGAAVVAGGGTSPAPRGPWGLGSLYVGTPGRCPSLPVGAADGARRTSGSGRRRTRSGRSRSGRVGGGSTA